ncbi:WD domain, G-beta repeat [Plasmodiophora brassicae]
MGNTCCSKRGQYRERQGTPPGPPATAQCGTQVHDDIVVDVCATEDPDVFLSASNDATIARFNWAEDRLLDRWKGHTSSVSKVLYANQLRRAISCSRDRSIRVWRAGQADAVSTVADAHRLPVTGLTINPEQTFVCSGARDYNVSFWDLATCRRLTTNETELNVVTAVKWIPDSASVLQCSEDLLVRVWDSRTGKLAQKFPGGTDFALCCDVSRNGYQAITGYNGFNKDACVLRLWDLRKMSLLATFTGHEQSVRSCAFLPGTVPRAVSTGKDSTLRIWNLDDGAGAAQTQTIPDASYSTCIAADMTRSGRHSVTRRPNANLNVMRALTPRPDQIYSGCANAFVCVWNVGDDGLAQMRCRTAPAPAS